MSEEIKAGDWVRFKSSGFTNEGRVVRVEESTYNVEVPTGATSIYVDVPKGPKVKKADPPQE